MSKITMLLAAFILFIEASCKKNAHLIEPLSLENNKEINDYTKSHLKWLSEKQKHNNSYTYVISFTSWAGFGENTSITIKEGEIISRTYELWRYEQGGSSKKIIESSWREVKNEINSHLEGAQAQTLDQIYTTCSQDWLKKNTKTNIIYFEGKNNGLISLCGYVPKNCADDCLTGVTISSIEWLE